MEYSDNLIPSAEIFAKMAKEYDSRLKREKLYNSSRSEVEESLINEICSNLKFLNWLYGYVKKNIKSTKMKSLFLNLEEECKSDFKMIENNFFSKPNKNNLIKSKKLNNFLACIKYAIFNEAQLTQKLFMLLNYQGCEFVFGICNKHLEFIQKLSIY